MAKEGGQEPADLELKPALWPWVVAGAVILAMIGLGIATGVSVEGE